jgi:hypothetical protein
MQDGKDLSTPADGPESEWEDVGMCGDYYELRHVPCGSKVLIAGGFARVCPKCQPEEWDRRSRVVWTE